MYRLWGMIKKKNKIIRDMVVEYNREPALEGEGLRYCLEKICYEFDLQQPMWLPKNQRDYEQFRRVVFDQDNFLEKIPFDTLEIEVLEDK